MFILKEANMGRHKKNQTVKSGRGDKLSSQKHNSKKRYTVSTYMWTNLSDLEAKMVEWDIQGTLDPKTKILEVGKEIKWSYGGINVHDCEEDVSDLEGIVTIKGKKKKHDILDTCDGCELW